MYDTIFKDILSFVSTIMNVLCYSFQFVIIVLLSARIQVPISDMKRNLVNALHADYSSCVDEHRNVNVGLLMSTLDSFKEEVTVTAMGMLKMERNIILVSLSVIVTYEFLIVQILERP
ncbi:hypothetical protein JTE90_004320 [Oedothorax gibbosus]|uniref:Gustatory receptor n=1 Tax=Oedothorax gibbosus TaxID=931172 RepID=A0AAV6VNB5_9ARAC|nr:hypothetical protein JTE90_004320 [Oedothorax gibbosus]